jgi:hypothetical protein
VVEARHLAAMSSSGVSDPMCTVTNSFNKQKFKTKKAAKTLSPIWNESFKLYTSKAEGQIHVKLWDYHLISKDEFMGETYVNLGDFAEGEEVDKWYQLQNEPTKKKQDPNQKGEVRIKCQFTGPPGSKPSKPSASSTTSPSSKEPAKEKPKEKEKEDKSKSSTKEGPVKIEDKYNVGDVVGRYGNSFFFFCWIFASFLI